MKIDVRFRGLEGSDALREHILRRIRFKLSRFARQVSSVVVRMGDVNGPKGGVDKRCHVTVRGPALPSTTIENLNADAYVAVDLAVERAGQTVARELGRVRTVHRAATPLPAS
jgi:ribosome-associated translation inhibitor RaiA